MGTGEYSKVLIRDIKGRLSEGFSWLSGIQQLAGISQEPVDENWEDEKIEEGSKQIEDIVRDIAMALTEWQEYQEPENETQNQISDK